MVDKLVGLVINEESIFLLVLFIKFDNFVYNYCM